MLKRIISTSFLAAMLLLATASAMAKDHWLLLAFWTILTATLLGFRIAEGLATNRRLSIWAGPQWAMQPAPQPRAYAPSKAA